VKLGEDKPLPYGQTFVLYYNLCGVAAILKVLSTPLLLSSPFALRANSIYTHLFPLRKFGVKLGGHKALPYGLFCPLGKLCPAGKVVAGFIPALCLPQIILAEL
jgi:hypothetical protein